MKAPEPLFLDSRTKWPNAVLPYGTDGPMTPVIMLHGLESHSAWFVQSASYIASLGHPVYALDRRGSGHSVAPRGRCQDFQDLLSDIDEIAAQILPLHNAEQFHLLGHCFGAIPAIAYACRFPSRLKSLLLATPAIYTIAEPPLMDKLNILWAALSGRDIEIPVPLEAEWFTDQQEYIDFIRNDPLSLEYAGARLYWETRRARNYIHANESKLQMPVFMAIAGKDRICNNARNRDFFARLVSEKKQSAIYPEAVHILEFSNEKPSFFTALSNWFTEVGNEVGTPT